MSTALAQTQDNVPANVEQHPASDSQALIAMIERVALNPAIDIDKMERLLQMQERIMTRNAEQAFNEAMKDAQRDMGRVAADADNSQTRSKYATYGKLDAVVRPIYTKHGFALSFDTGRGAPEGCISVVAIVSHEGGFTRQYHADMPADGKGARGGDVMTKTHATGAAMSYGMRYLLKMIFNIAVGEDDTDGNAPVDATLISEDQALAINDLIDVVVEEKGPEGNRPLYLKNFLAYMKAKTVSDIPAADYQKAIDAINSTRPRK